ncbi:hypothetical protein [Salinisphaera orenii]|uniref:hypothetical protein n=1 Tax=Salinisphaera orenii TaxID=856731 RepID=UPI000DBE137F
MALIRIKASMDRSGNVSATPVDPTWQQAFAAHVSSFTGRPVDDETEVFFQDGNSAHEFIHNDVPMRFRGMLSDGWTIEFDVDPWVVGHWYGYDAHTVAISG